MSPDQQSYLLLGVATVGYAALLHWLDRAYEPDWTILTVVAGVALTGAGVAFRLTLGVPPLPPEAVAWWVWWSAIWHFVVSGSVIGVWQAIQMRRRLLDYIAYLRRRRGDGGTPEGSA
jgi:hypothetical protein